MIPIRRRVLSFAAAVFVAALGSMPSAPCVQAIDDVMTYEVVSNFIDRANIVYMDPQRRVYIWQAALPWRVDTAVLGGLDRAEIRADWRPNERPNKWVTVRIIHDGKVLCQSTLDLGNATCYGNTPHIF